MNRIVKVEIVLDIDTDNWYVSVTKEFAPENGGGTQVFDEAAGKSIHGALEIARAIVTVTPAARTDK